MLWQGQFLSDYFGYGEQSLAACKESLSEENDRCALLQSQGHVQRREYFVAKNIEQRNLGQTPCIDYSLLQATSRPEHSTEKDICASSCANTCEIKPLGFERNAQVHASRSAYAPSSTPEHQPIPTTLSQNRKMAAPHREISRS